MKTTDTKKQNAQQKDQSVIRVRSQLRAGGVISAARDTCS